MTKHITETKFWNEVMKGVYGPRKGGSRIIVDAAGAETGVGKTGLAVSLARLFSRAFEYDLQKEDFTLSGDEYLERWREHPDSDQPSVIVLDELSGAGAGDSRKAMTHQNVNLGRSWQLMRKKRIVTITTLPHWADAEKRMRRFANYRLVCQKEPIGYFVPYRVGASFDDGDVMTRRVGDVNRIKFPNLDKHSDPFYSYVSALKDDLLESEFFDADDLSNEEESGPVDPDEVEREEKISIAQRMRDRGYTLRDIADAVGMSKSWVSYNTTQSGGGQADA